MERLTHLVWIIHFSHQNSELLSMHVRLGHLAQCWPTPPLPPLLPVSGSSLTWTPATAERELGCPHLGSLGMTTVSLQLSVFLCRRSGWGTGWDQWHGSLWLWRETVAWECILKARVYYSYSVIRNPTPLPRRPLEPSKFSVGMSDTQCNSPPDRSYMLTTNHVNSVGN